jgi:hypothetical protein
MLDTRRSTLVYIVYDARKNYGWLCRSSPTTTVTKTDTCARALSIRKPSVTPTAAPSGETKPHVCNHTH